MPKGLKAFGISLGLVASAALAHAQASTFDAHMKQADDNEQTAAGQAYRQIFQRAYGAEFSARYSECLGRAGGLAPTEPFEMLFKLGPKGTTDEAGVRPETTFSTCFLELGRKVVFPAPPFPDYWIANKMMFSAPSPNSVTPNPDYEHSLHAEVEAPGPGDSPEVARLYREDIADRSTKTIDWALVHPRDLARLKRLKELFASDGLRTARDYYHAALVLQHADASEDYLLAHEFCVAAMILGKNDHETKWLAAVTEDRFLMSIGRPQRFATQFRSEGNGPLLLYQVSEQVTDALRRLMTVPTLAEAKATEAESKKK